MATLLDTTYLLHFLETHGLGVLSTVREDRLPDAAPIYFIVKESFDIFFVTTTETQKYFNIKRHPQVLLTITDEISMETVQVRGTISEDTRLVDDVVEIIDRRLLTHRGSVPTIPFMETHGQRTVLKITPHQIRMRQYSLSGLVEDEIDFTKSFHK